MRRATELTQHELFKAVQNVLAFVEFAFFAERDIDDTYGLCLGLEMLALTLGLTEKDGTTYDPADLDYDSAVMMQEFVEVLDTHAMKYFKNAWLNTVRSNLPYLRGIEG